MGESVKKTDLQLIVDLDGFIANFTRGVTAAHGRPETDGLTGEWNFHHKWGINDEAFYAACDRPFWANLDVWPDGMAVLKGLVAVYGTGPICFLTSPTQTEGTHQGKRDWFRKHVAALGFNEWADLFIGSAKWKFAHPKAVLIDDSDDNAKKFAAPPDHRAGGKAWVPPRPWNHNRDLCDLKTGLFDAEMETTALLRFLAGLES